MLDLRRREFVALLGSVAAAWPLAARAEQAERMRRIGVLMSLAADDPESQARLTAFAQGLQELGWSVGRNLRIDYRWAAGDANRSRSYTTELLALAPDVILAVGSTSTGPVQQATHSVPVVFVQVGDPVGAGFVESLARPGGNVTGFTVFEYGISGKWLELLKEVAPWVTRAAVLRDTSIAAGAGQLLVTNHNRTAGFALKGRLPSVFGNRGGVDAGGLMSYVADQAESYRLVATYIDKIIKGTKPAELPVQQPTKFELAFNLKTAKQIGVTIPQSLLYRADRVIK